MIIIANHSVICMELIKNAEKTIKLRTLRTKRIYDDKIIYKFYVCNTATYNWFLNLYYPKAELIMEQTHYIKN